MKWIFIIAILTSCARPPTPQPAAADTRLQDTTLLSNLLADKVNFLNQRIEILENKVESEWLPLDFNSAAYRKLTTSLGPLLVSAQDASPYLDGYKIHLSVGNPFALAYDGFTLHASWIDFTNLDDDSKNKQSEEQILTRLYSGAWTPVDFTVSPATAKDLQHLSIRIVPNEILLQRRPTK